MRRNRLTRRIFGGTVLAALLAVLVCVGIFAGFFYSRMADASRGNLREEASYIARAVELGGLQYLRSLEPQDRTRVTWVAADGNVLFDTDVDAAGLENHADREEIWEALESGVGESGRYSSTLAEKTLNYAVRIADGTVVRFSAQQATAFSLLRQTVLPVVAALLAVGALAVLLAARTARDLVRPINKIDLQDPGHDPVYEELQPLVRRITAQNRQIQEQMEHLTQAHEKQDRFRREFTANVSHELKTPLTSISGFAEIIRDGLVRPQDVGHFADNIYKEAQRLIVLVGDIIKITQMDDKQLPIQREPLDLTALCRQVAQVLQPAAERLGVQIQVKGEPQTVIGARQIAEEMLYNLCDNAVKYNHPGGRVTLQVEPKQQTVEVSVTDTGIGIPKEHQERVFERFYRVDKNRSKEIGGTGLGLSIVKHGAIYHGAALSLRSEPGVGTTITVAFPRKGPPADS